MKIIKSYASWFLLLFVIGITSCEKTEIKDGGGKTLVKIVGGGENPVVLPMDVVPQIEEMVIVDLRKDAVTEADASAATTVTLTNTQAFLDAYNTANGTSYELLPTSAYTITPGSGVTVNGNTWTINLAPGELARPISITLDKNQMDLAKSYAFGLQITQTTVGSPSLGSGFAIINPLVINEYDGMYSYTGSIVRNSSSGPDPALSGNISGVDDIELATTGPNSVELEGLYWANGTGVGGVAGTTLTVDPVTNLVTVTCKTNPTMKNTVGEVNEYDPSTKTFTLAFDWGTAPNTRATKIVLTYTGPR
jgi:BT_3987-like, N-terminal domain/Domain of unknown function (DUF7015)